ncbi:MAG: TylF/MycF family methyltransferase [Rubrivivax sp.]|nr:TylF/MycF family methyltransferase [Rubrivivax sp.]
MDNAQTLYLDLMKKTISFALWPDPPVPMVALNDERPPLKRMLVAWVDKWLNKRSLQLVKRPDYSERERLEGRVWPGYADSMIGLARLDNLQRSIETVLADGIEGDFIETGVWRGGACVFMRAALAAYEDHTRRVFVADSFAGLPEPDLEKYPADRGDRLHVHSYLAISRDQVAANFRKYGLLDDQVVFLEGWFKDTLPHAPIDKLAILRLDGDMYGSTIDALESLYDKLSPGGFCIVDDYALPGCKAAVSDFRAAHGIDETIHAIDWTGSFWRKRR